MEEKPGKKFTVGNKEKRNKEGKGMRRETA